VKNPVFKTIAVVMASLLLIVGCGKKLPEPFTPNAKTDKCALCNMAVKDDHFATEVILENGKKLAFDDLGCLDKYMKQNKSKKAAVSYVRDYKTNKWVQLENATYVHDNDVAKTPMAYNVISFTTKEDAQKFIDNKKGQLLTYKELKKYNWERDPAAMKKLMEMKMKREAEKANKMGNNGSMENNAADMKK
jgi:copper chaperone NosL